MKLTDYNKSLSCYHQARWKKIYRYIEEYAKTKDNLTLHLLRVEIKRLIALVNFLKYTNADFNKGKPFKALKKYISC